MFGHEKGVTSGTLTFVVCCCNISSYCFIFGHEKEVTCGTLNYDYPRQFSVSIPYYSDYILYYIPSFVSGAPKLSSPGKCGTAGTHTCVPLTFNQDHKHSFHLFGAHSLLYLYYVITILIM